MKEDLMILSKIFHKYRYKFKKESVFDVIKEMGLDYLGVHHYLPPSGRVTISRYACGDYKDYSPEELLRKPIPIEFVQRIQRLFSTQDVVVSDVIVTEHDLENERLEFMEMQGD